MATQFIKGGKNGRKALRVGWSVDDFGQDIWPFFCNEAIDDLQKNGFDIGPADWYETEYHGEEGVRVRPGLYKMKRKEVVGA